LIECSGRPRQAAIAGQQLRFLSDLAHEDPWCGHRFSRPKSRAAYASLGHSAHLAGVRDQDGTLSAFSVKRCPPSRWNAVRHQSGMVSGMAWNTQGRTLRKGSQRTGDSLGPDVPATGLPWDAQPLRCLRLHRKGPEHLRHTLPLFKHPRQASGSTAGYVRHLRRDHGRLSGGPLPWRSAP
jgi:hypothetical protein